jgi:hypothetical protein
MSEDVNNPRPWKTIAPELSKELDPKKVLALSQELNRALEQLEQAAKPAPRRLAKSC